MEYSEVRPRIITAGWNGHESRKDQPVNSAILSSATQALLIAKELIDENLKKTSKADELSFRFGMSLAMETLTMLISSVSLSEGEASLPDIAGTEPRLTCKAPGCEMTAEYCACHRSINK
jgi:hypothetical protein